MIQVKDLRIGSWIFDDTKTYSKVIGFNPFGHSVRCDEEEGCEILLDLYLNDGTIRKGMYCESTECSPIPLTEEILLKLGFVDYILNFDNIWIECNPLITMVGQINNDRGVVLDNKVEYLHQLQDLFNRFTGKELPNIKF